jgi:hypothetical protein
MAQCSLRKAGITFVASQHANLYAHTLGCQIPMALLLVFVAFCAGRRLVTC